MKVNNLPMLAAVTAAVVIMVIGIPLADRKISRHLGLNLRGGISRNPAADSLLRLRKGILLFLFLIYITVFAWLVFFSRSATQDYQVHVEVLNDLANSISMDLGVFNILHILLTDGYEAARSHVAIINAADIYQVYLNMALFIPMGFLLPYVFDWFRARPRLRPVVGCFIISFITENLQLIARRGFYDIDDLISNTVGGFIGQMLFIVSGYVVTHPEWKKELRQYRRWRKNARVRTLYPFIRKIGLARTTLMGTDEVAIWDFYVQKLGFRPRKQFSARGTMGTQFLFEMGEMQLVIICSKIREELFPQYLTLSAKKLGPIRERLEENDIETGEYEEDPYTGLKKISFEGPDGVQITIVENG